MAVTEPGVSLARKRRESWSTQSLPVSASGALVISGCLRVSPLGSKSLASTGMRTTSPTRTSTTSGRATGGCSVDAAGMRTTDDGTHGGALAVGDRVVDGDGEAGIAHVGDLHNVVVQHGDGDARRPSGTSTPRTTSTPPAGSVSLPSTSTRAVPPSGQQRHVLDGDGGQLRLGRDHVNADQPRGALRAVGDLVGQVAGAQRCPRRR